ncbi:MAG: energy-coupling factor transporter transmembrane component T family protein [Candidatus Helarchaeota archaeon]
MSFIPFRLINEKNYLAGFNSETRFITSLIIAVYLSFTTKFYVFFIILGSHLILGLITRANYWKIFKRFIIILPVMIFFTIFIPFYREPGFDPFIWFKILYHWELGPFKIYIYSDRLEYAALILIRMVSIFLIFMIYLSSLSFTEFVTIRLLPKSIASSLIIMLRYIPDFLAKNNSLVESQKLRGRELIKSNRNRIRLAGFVIGTTLVKTIEKSEVLFESMMMRGFSGKITITRKPIKYYDFIFLGLIILFLLSTFILIEVNPIFW